MNTTFTAHGFLPDADPLQKLPAAFERLDTLGRDLPSLLEDKDARPYLRAFDVPPWPTDAVTSADLPALRLYYVRLGFAASGYVNQVGQPPATTLPKNLAVPLCRAAKLLDRPPILSYDGYALYNWYRIDRNGPVALCCATITSAPKTSSTRTSGSSQYFLRGPRKRQIRLITRP